MPVEAIAYGFNVIYSNNCYKDFKGIMRKLEGSINTPTTEDKIGILKFFVSTGTLEGKRLPFWICAWGIVGEIIGGKLPLLVAGENKVLYPQVCALFGTIDALPVFHT